MDSERILAAIVKSSSDGILVFDPDDKITICNTAMETIFGVNSEEIIGRSIYDVFPFLLDKGHQDHFANLLAGKHLELSNVKHSMLGSDGKLSLEMSCSVISNSQGNPVGVMVLVRDVTQQRWVEDALWENQRAYTNLTSIIPGVAYFCRNDQSWTMEYVSEACAELTGYDSSDLILNRKAAYADLILPEDRGLVADTVQEGIRHKTSFQLEYRIRARDGQEKWV